MSVLDGKVALVTGSSRGIGAAIATRFATEGAAIALQGRDAGALAAVQDRIVRAGGRAEEGWRASVDGNLTATFLTIKAVITMSSAAARRPHPRSPLAYAAAKAGIQMLTQHLAAQAGPFGIRVSCIAPETILTETNLARIPESQRPLLIEQHPIRRLGAPEDVAAAARFLASDDSSWTTGIILDVAGGAVMT